MNSKYEVSILLPTYRRINSLMETLNSLKSTGDNYEVILCISDDDDETIKCTSEYTQIITPLKGYEHVHTYYNLAAESASGEYLWILNDDCIISTTGWNNIIKNSMAHDSIGITKTAEFPVISKNAFRVLGHLSHHPYIDNWIVALGTHHNSLVHLPIDIIHNKKMNGGRYQPPHIKNDEIAVNLLKKDCELFNSHYNAENKL